MSPPPSFRLNSRAAAFFLEGAFFRPRYPLPPHALSFPPGRGAFFPFWEDFSFVLAELHLFSLFSEMMYPLFPPGPFSRPPPGQPSPLG